MTTFGICGKVTARGLSPMEMGKVVEELGFDSLWLGEHPHTPDPDREGIVAPNGYDEMFDPLLSLAAAAAVTSRIKLGVAVSLVPIHHPIHLAKMSSTLDQISGGRFQLGVGAGWRQQEIEDFGTSFADRWKVLRDTVLAVREIWTNDVAEYHGNYVNLEPMKCWPKPVQPGGVPVLEGSYSRFTAKRIAEYCDGWIGWEGGSNDELRVVAEQIREEWKNAGRTGSPDMTMIFDLDPAQDPKARMDAYREIGFGRLVFLMNPGNREEQLEQLHWLVKVRDDFIATQPAT